MTCSKERTESTGTGQTSTSGRSSRFTGERCSTSRNISTKNQNNKGEKLLNLIKIFSCKVILTSCDEFSRTHLASEGVELAPMEPPTIDPYEVSREAVGPEGQRQEHSTKDTYDSLKQFLHHDRKVLRYFAHSETPFTPLGKTYKKKYIICFFLSDNSLEVRSNPQKCIWTVCVPIFEKKFVFSGSRCAGQLRVQRSRHLPKIPQKATSSKNQVFAQENLQHLVFALPPRI